VNLSNPLPIVVNTINKVDSRVIKLNQNRPLNYVEECVSSDDPQTVRVGTSLLILSYYLYKVILPYPMSFYYGYSFIHPQSVMDPISLLGLLAISCFYWVLYFLQESIRF
jgi:hypothetical protein